MKRTAMYFVAVLLSMQFCFAGNKPKETTIHILSVNDMHATISLMPKFAAVVDSLRQIDPDLIVLSGGDNRTGEPHNDRYEIPAYPMVAFMNAVGFDASAIGNHEWDNKWSGLRTLQNLASFPYLCCNVETPDTMNMLTKPFTFLDVKGFRIGILGSIQLGMNGIPDCHPDNIKGIKFRQPDDAIPEYQWMRKQCDYLILLSHDGYAADTITANLFPYFDQIIGGHTHTLVKPNAFYNGVLVTQAKNKLAYATYTTIVLNKKGKVVSKSCEQIDVKNFGSENKEVARLLEVFMHNEELSQTVCTVAKDFKTTEELGNMMTDAILVETKSDVAMQNGGGVRFDKFAAGPMTVNDILQLDPFGNEAVVYKLTGRQIADIIMQCFYIDEKQVPYVAGITYEMKIDSDKKPTGIEIHSLDPSKPFDLEGTYQFVTNSYVSAILKFPSEGQSTYHACSDHMMDFLRSKQTVDYQGTHRAVVKQ